MDASEPCRIARTLDLPAVRARNVRVALGRALTASGAYAEAVEAYRDAARVTPDDAESWLRLGEALLHLRADPQGAVDELQVALRIDPHSARGYGALGAALHALGEYPEAAASFAEALRLDPDFLVNRPAAREREAASGS
jgi:cytochrome c-type biogenesis protein CcmH/NrfG